ncbi:hypothetical protein [Paenibacillus sp. GCM10012306]|uniref:hypothetical protein n=1 Tax=Paenibacillus sp. GCM10012306 TaxID=3317342 RepID=UPI00360DC98D
MRVVGSKPQGKLQTRAVYGYGVRRRYSPRYGPPNEAVFILILFLLLIVILLYFT